MRETSLKLKLILVWVVIIALTATTIVVTHKTHEERSGTVWYLHRVKIHGGAGGYEIFTVRTEAGASWSFYFYETPNSIPFLENQVAVFEYPSTFERPEMSEFCHEIRGAYLRQLRLGKTPKEIFQERLVTSETDKLDQP